MYGHPDAVRHSVRMPYIPLLILTFLADRSISVKTSLINTKLENLVNLGVLFLTLFTDSYLVLHGLKSGNMDGLMSLE